MSPQLQFWYRGARILLKGEGKPLNEELHICWRGLTLFRAEWRTTCLRAALKASKRIWANIKGAWSLTQRLWKGLSKSLPGIIVKFRDWEDCAHVPTYNHSGVLRAGWGQIWQHSPICKQINQQRVETTQMSIYRSMDTEKVVYSWNGILFSLKKERSPASCNNIDESGGRHAKWNKAVTEGQILHYSTYMNYLD